MPGSDRHSTPRHMYLISHYLSIFVPGINLRLRALKITMQVIHCTVRSLLLPQGKLYHVKPCGEWGLSAQFTICYIQAIFLNCDPKHLHQNNLGVSLKGKFGSMKPEIPGTGPRSLHLPCSLSSLCTQL